MEISWLTIWESWSVKSSTKGKVHKITPNNLTTIDLLHLKIRIHSFSLAGTLISLFDYGWDKNILIIQLCQHNVKITCILPSRLMCNCLRSCVLEHCNVRLKCLSLYLCLPHSPESMTMSPITSLFGLPSRLSKTSSTLSSSVSPCSYKTRRNLRIHMYNIWW